MPTAKTPKPLERDVLKSTLAVFKVEIPNWHPARLNELMRGHWSNGARRKRADRATIANYCRLANVPPAESKRRVRLTIVLGKGQRGGDPDAYWKTTLDALTKCKALKDDNRQWCELVPVEFDRAEAKATVIQLEETA